MTQKKINNYIIYLKQILGKGAFGSVYRGEHDTSKLSVAVKILQKHMIDHDEYLKAALFSEIQILQLLKSENIIRVLDVMESSHNYYIIQELCDSDLEHYIKDKPQLSQADAVGFLTQICNGFMALVKEGIVHRDLKPANIMLCKGVIKIGDFGFAKRNVTKRMKNQTSVGTPLYMSLQVLKSQPYTSKCDIWATGFIFYQMLHGKTPWTAHSQFELVKNIETKPLIINPNFSAETNDFLRKCLQREEKDRLSWDEIFVHPIFKGYFHQYAKQNQLFEDKLKMVMTELRFQINSKNIDLNRLLESLGFAGIQQLKYTQFQKFLKHIHPEITKDEVKFFFEKMDTNADGSISLTELSTEMQKHYISFSKLSPQLHHQLDSHGIKVKKTESLECFDNKKLSSELELRVKKCFIKLYKIITSKKITLYKTFQAYDFDNKGELTIQKFQKIMSRLDQSFSHEDIAAAFDFIDTDKSKTIEFSQLRRYYCKVNGIPQSLETEETHSQMKSPHSHSHSHRHHSHSHSHHSHQRHHHQEKGN